MNRPFPPTPRQADLLRFITGYWETHGTHPSYRTMQAGLGLANVSQAYGLFDRLAQRNGLHPVSIPRDPDGSPLYFVPVERA